MSRGAKEGVVLVQALISVVSDFAFATLPIVFLWRVQIDFKTKIGLWFLMCLGFITGACCLVRTVLNNQALPDNQTYDGIVNWVWRLFEVQIGIIAACIPTLRPLYKWFMERVRGHRAVGMDANIHFPLTNNKPQSWIEPVGERCEPSSEVARERYVDNVDHPDTMRDELVGERTISIERRHNIGTAHSDYAPAENARDSALEEEMIKYGINDSP